MKTPVHFKSRRSIMLGCIALAALPAVALLPGCGGGSSGNSFGTFRSNVALSSVQTASITLNTGGGGVNGFLTVADPNVVSAASKGTRAFGFVVPQGNYAFTGNFSEPASFSAAGTFPGAVRFTIVGQIPANGGSGNYTIRANGQLVTGTLFPDGTTPTPTATTITN